MEESFRGSCLCGSVTYEVAGPLRPIVACHCVQCRKQTGHYYAATNAPDGALSISGDALKWYQSSARARRGFCGECGSALFWKHDEDSFTSILAGSLDGRTGLQIAKHIYCSSKGDYYEITDGLPQE